MSFRDSHSNLKIETGLILYTGMEAYKVNDHVLAVPWNVLVE
jgi:hypothetical protein